MAEGVDAGVDPVKSSRRHPPGDGAVADPGNQELLLADYAVLRCRRRRQPFCVNSPPLSGGNSTQIAHGTSLGPNLCPRAPRLSPFICRSSTLHAATRLGNMSDESTPSSVEELDDELATEAEQPEGLDSEALERRSEALSQVIKFGDPVLRSPASPVSEFDEELEGEAERMIGLMRDAIGVGLAATQLGTLRRMLVFQVGSEAEPTVLVNPEIEWRSEDDFATAEEGCLSLPGVIVDVERPLHVRARGLDVRGEPLSIEASGLEARVIQHEVDHLDGVLMIDRAEREQKRGALRALREGGTYAPDRPEDEEEESPRE
jgi:peptide deformylase